MKAMDNGKFVLGAPHGDGEGPDPEEIMMAMRVGGEGGGGEDGAERRRQVPVQRGEHGQAGDGGGEAGGLSQKGENLGWRQCRAWSNVQLNTMMRAINWKEGCRRGYVTQGYARYG